jgi:hypothetical protein
MPYLEIPLQPVPQNLAVKLLGVDYQFRVRYHDAPEAGWTLDISRVDGERLVSGIPLTLGGDLLGQYVELGIGGGLWLGPVGQVDPFAPIPYEALGDTYKLYYREYRR